jgi:hypothetical protein
MGMDTTSATGKCGAWSATAALAEHRNAGPKGTETRANGQGDHTSRRDAGHRHVPVWRGTQLGLGRPAGGVQAG